MGKKWKDSINNDEGSGIPIEILMNPKKLDEYLLRQQQQSAVSDAEVTPITPKKLVPTNYQKSAKPTRDVGAMVASMITERNDTPVEPAITIVDKADDCRGSSTHCVNDLGSCVWRPHVTLIETRYGLAVNIGGRTYPIIPGDEGAVYSIRDKDIDLATIMYILAKSEWNADVIYPQDNSYITNLEDIMMNIGPENVIMVQDGKSIQVHVIDHRYIEDDFVPALMECIKLAHGDFTRTLMHIFDNYSHWPTLLPIENIPEDTIKAQIELFEAGISEYYTSDGGDSDDILALDAPSFSEYVRDRIDAWTQLWGDENEDDDDDEDESEEEEENYLPSKTIGGASNDDDPFLGSESGNVGDNAESVRKETDTAPDSSDSKGRSDDKSVGVHPTDAKAVSGKDADIPESTGVDGSREIPGKEAQKETPQKGKAEGNRSGKSKPPVKETAKKAEEKEVTKPEPAPVPEPAPAPKVETPSDNDDSMTLPVITVGRKKK